MALTTKVYVQNVGLFLFLFSAAIGMGTQILVGHMVGAGDMETAYRRCLRSLKMAISISLAVSVVIALSAPALFPLFTNNKEIIALASAVMLWGIVLEPGRCFNLVIINSLRAAGDTRFPVLMGILSMWGVSVPLAWWLGVHLEMGLIGVYLSFIVDEWLRGLIMLWRWRSRVWQTMSFVSKS
jgi:Na+-driven multidrug efflux pump